MADVEKEKVKGLMAKKDEIENEIKEFQEILDSQKDVGMDGKLVDDEGYPRNDIDVYTVRLARNKIICLQNDYKAIMKDIEQGLHKIHASAKDNRTIEDEKPRQDESSSLIPFLKVDSVSEGSPAKRAGLQKQDLIFKFGSLTHKNFKELQNVASIVQHSKGVPLQVIVLRNDEKLHLSLTPNTWSGRGLLGCHVLPISKS